MSGCKEAINKIQIFLQECGLSKYWPSFQKHGFYKEIDLAILDEDVLHQLGVRDNSDIQTITKKVSAYKSSDRFRLLEWLNQHGIGDVADLILAEGLGSIEEIRRVPDVESFLTLAADVKQLTMVQQVKLKHAGTLAPSQEVKDICDGRVNSLQKRPRRSTSSSPDGSHDTQNLPCKVWTDLQEVALGRWKKPTDMSDAVHPFLCVEAKLTSTLDAQCSIVAEFILDTGSDLITITEEHFKELNPEPVRLIESRGMHTTQTKQLYTANITLGRVTLHGVEVIVGRHASLGSEVVRQFTHIIDKNGHVWLENAYE